MDQCHVDPPPDRGRRWLLWGFAATTFAAVTGGAAAVVSFLRSGPGGAPPRTVVVMADELPGESDPPLSVGIVGIARRIAVVRLKAGDGPTPASPVDVTFPASPTGGYLALSQKCPHLGCTVPWRPEWKFQSEQGVFRCPCHSSTYTLAGLRVFGPAPRSLDTFEAELTDTGSLVVYVDQVVPGDDSNALRAIPPQG